MYKLDGKDVLDGTPASGKGIGRASLQPLFRAESMVMNQRWDIVTEPPGRYRNGGCRGHRRLRGCARSISGTRPRGTPSQTLSVDGGTARCLVQTGSGDGSATGRPQEQVIGFRIESPGLASLVCLSVYKVKAVSARQVRHSPETRLSCCEAMATTRPPVRLHIASSTVASSVRRSSTRRSRTVSCTVTRCRTAPHDWHITKVTHFTKNTVV